MNHFAVEHAPSFAKIRVETRLFEANHRLLPGLDRVLEPLWQHGRR